MNIIWLGHGSFRIEIEDQVLLIDPWLTGNPMLEESKHSAALNGATDIPVTHAHFDHDALHRLDAHVLLDRLIGMYKFGDMTIYGLADKHEGDSSGAI